MAETPEVIARPGGGFIAGYLQRQIERDPMIQRFPPPRHRPEHRQDRPERHDDTRRAALLAMLAAVVWALVIAGIVVLAFWLLP